MGGEMLEDILAIYSNDIVTQQIQRAETTHRLKLVDFWGIKEGDRVLEIGCGQGDTTLALAFSVGKNGFVHGIDLADENYGSPETIGKARKRILSSPVGDRIEMTFKCDILGENIDFEENSFDCVVLSHCLWYFSEYETLERILRKVKRYAPKVCIAEWDPGITDSDQLAHLQAVKIQSVCESFRQDSDSNIRTLFYPEDILMSVAAGGYKVDKTARISSPEVYDGKWEVEMTLAEYPSIIRRQKDMPDRLKELLLSEIHTLRKATKIKPLSSFALTAERS